LFVGPGWPIPTTHHLRNDNDDDLGTRPPDLYLAAVAIVQSQIVGIDSDILARRSC